MSFSVVMLDDNHMFIVWEHALQQKASKKDLQVLLIAYCESCI